MISPVVDETVAEFATKTPSKKPVAVPDVLAFRTIAPDADATDPPPFTAIFRPALMAIAPEPLAVTFPLIETFCMADSVMPPLTVLRLEPLASAMLLSAVKVIVPVPLTAISDAAVPKLMVSPATVTFWPAASVNAALRLMMSLPASPLMVNDLSNAASNDDAVTVSFPVPALMVNDPVGLENVTDSLKFESIVMFAPAASVSVIVSAPPLNVKTRSITLRLSVIGSSPL